MADELKVFISWSGDLAKQIAIELRNLLPVIFDRVAPWVSDRDIEAGGRSMQEIAQELDGTSFGIIVVTRANQNSQWLNFEAGALSKRFQADEHARVVPLLVDLSGMAELTGPLTQFQAKLLNEQGVQDLFIAVGAAVGVGDEVVIRRLRNEWDPFQERVARHIGSHGHDQSQPRRDADSMIEETLQLVRSLAQQLDAPSVRQTSQKKNRLSVLQRALEMELSKRETGAWRVEPVDHTRVDVEVWDASIGDSSERQLELYKALERVLKSHRFDGYLSLTVNEQDVPPF